MKSKLDETKIFKNYSDVVQVKDLQKMLGIGRNSAYNLVSRKVIASVKSGNKILIPKQNVIDYLNGGNNE